jgi:NDP-sugar pyrophosphorylase family protein
MKDKITITIDKKILKNVDVFVDRIYIRNRSQAIEYLLEKRLDESKTAVILATGPSENLRISASEFRPTAKIGNTTVIELAMKNLRQNNFKKIFIVGEQPVLTSIFSLIGDGRRYGVSIRYIEEENSPGTADSLRLLKDELKTTFLVVFSDIVFNKMDIEKLWKHHFNHKGTATLMVTNSSLIKGGIKKPVKRSFVRVEGDMVIRAFEKQKSVNKTREDFISFSSLFVAESEILHYSGSSLENDIFPTLAEKGFLYSYLSSEGETHIHSKEDVSLIKRDSL